MNTLSFKLAGNGEHPDIIEAIETEMKQIAEYDDMLEMVNKYFNA